MRRRRVANEGRQREVGFCNKGWKLGERGREKVREKEGWIEGCVRGKRVGAGRVEEDSYTLGAYSCRVPNTFFPRACNTYVGRGACIEIARAQGQIVHFLRNACNSFLLILR